MSFLSMVVQILLCTDIVKVLVSSLIFLISINNVAIDLLEKITETDISLQIILLHVVLRSSGGGNVSYSFIKFSLSEYFA